MRRKRDLTPDDRAVWAAITKGVKPYHASSLALSTPQKKKPAASKTPLAPRRQHSTHTRPASLVNAPVSLPATHAGDPKLDKRAARGRLAIDATLDMHGMHQTAAQTALRRFITQAALCQFRCVLVITGKGSISSERGILRRRFFEWVEEPQLREHISRVATAHQRHGGGGAFYIFLKRSKHKTVRTSR